MLDEIRSAAPGETLWDKGEKASVKGLHVRVTTDGTKCFYFFYRTKTGQQRKPKLGELGQLTLSEARKLAKAMADRVALGDDPKGGWQEKKAELTVSELFDQCYAKHWDNPRYHLSGWAKQCRWFWDKHLKSEFGHMRLSDVTAVRVRGWHSTYEEKPYNGNRAMEVLSRCFRFAEEQELRPQHTNPCSLVKAHPEKKRKRYATSEEIQKLAAVLERETPNYPAAAAFIYLLIFTGSRPRAIERATWDQLSIFEVNGETHGVLTIFGKSSGKTGQDERVNLPPQAMKAISNLPRVTGGTITGIKMPRHLWRKIRAEVGCKDLWARDWRRTFATVGKSGGTEMGIIGELLNHHTAETTKIYAKVTDEVGVSASTAIANKMSELMAAKVSNNHAEKQS